MGKIVAQIGADGYLVGPTLADESPLEPGVYLIPGGAIDKALPVEMKPGKRYWPLEDGWREEDMPAPPQPDREQLLAAAQAQRDSLLQYATLRASPLQDAVDLDVATEAERVELAGWKMYRIQVSRVDLTAEAPAWPDRPDA